VRVLSVKIDSDAPIASSTAARLPQSVYELPTCPVCLERMDSAVTGLITVPCSHTFHCMCLSKWGDSRYATVHGSSLLATYVHHQMSRLSIFANTSFLTSYVVYLAFSIHPICECCHHLSFYVRWLSLHHKLVDLSDMWQYRLRAVRPCSCTCTL
jgi:hypothetical protein